MAPLKNLRQETFCLLVKSGMVPLRAYPTAGYRAANSSPYRLLENARVKSRMNELTRQMAKETRISVESLTSQLLDAIELAKAVKNLARSPVRSRSSASCMATSSRNARLARLASLRPYLPSKSSNRYATITARRLLR